MKNKQLQAILATMPDDYDVGFFLEVRQQYQSERVGKIINAVTPMTKHNFILLDNIKEVRVEC